MKSFAVIRSSHILKLKSTLQEMNKVGLHFECKPKEINISYAEKIFNSSSKNYEVCALVPLIEDCELCQSKVKNMLFYSEALIIGTSHELFNNFVKLMPALPDLVIPNVYYKEAPAHEQKARASEVFLGVFVNRKVQVQTNSGSTYTGVLKHADSIGVFFEPADDSSPLFITWHDIEKIIIPKEKKE